MSVRREFIHGSPTSTVGLALQIIEYHGSVYVIFGDAKYQVRYQAPGILEEVRIHNLRLADH